VQHYDALVTVSGDGLLNEILNGLLSRQDWQDAVKLPIGIVPAGEPGAIGGAEGLAYPRFQAPRGLAGSGNGLSRCIDCTTAPTAVHNLIRMNTQRLDIYRVWQAGKAPSFGFLVLSHGLIADIDIESERFRWAGAARFTMSGIQRMISLRRYVAKVWYLPAAHAAEYERFRRREESRHRIEGAVVTSAEASPRASMSSPSTDSGEVPPTNSLLATHPRLSKLPPNPQEHGWQVRAAARKRGGHVRWCASEAMTRCPPAALVRFLQCYDGRVCAVLALNAPWISSEHLFGPYRRVAAAYAELHRTVQQSDAGGVL
jgi:sphingosine kinase